MAEQTTTESTVAPVTQHVLAEPDPAQRPARLAMYLGVAMLALGAIALYLGYDGVAKHAVEVAQTPYLISGGIVGLALIGLGGVTLAVYVLLRVQGDLRSELRSMSVAIESLVDAMAAQVSYKTSNGSAPVTGDLVLVARGTSTFHAAGCRLVDRSEAARPLPRSEAQKAGMTACRICKP
jgi:hypothetical protein